MNAISPAIHRRPGRKRKAARITLPSYDTPNEDTIRQLVASGMEIAVEVYHTDAGERTQLRRQRIISPLEQLWKAGRIDAEQYGAARRYQRHADMAAVSGPRGVVRYEPRMIDGGAPAFLLPIEAAADHLAGLALAQLACGPKLRPVLDWIAVEPIGWREQAKRWWPGASEQHLRSEFQRRLRITCDKLERHYLGRRLTD